MLNRQSEKKIIPMDRYYLEDNFVKDPKAEEELSGIYKEVSDKFKSGALISGKVIEKDSGSITVSIDYKSDGVIPRYEFSEQELEKLKVGSEIEVMIEALEDMDGRVVLSYQKAKSLKIWSDISRIAETGESVSGRVTHKVKGGLNVDIGIPAFLPGSQVDLHRVTDFDQFVGKDVICKVIKVNKKRGNIILSRRKFLEEERSEGRKKALESLQEGQVIRGVVKNITAYGAFVDVGGIDGLLHITDISWGRISHPSEVLKIGDEVNVKILSFDKDNEKISLGIKQLQDNPWADIVSKFEKGSRLKGKISSITDYGLFVEVADGVEGLVHISEISWTERVQDLFKRYKVGDEIDVVISTIEQNERRMSLSIKRLDDDPWKVAFDKFKPGDQIDGVVSNIADFGIFVQISPGVDGLVHVSDISWTEHISNPNESFKKGDKVKVVVLSVEEEKRRISLGMKQLAKDPWESIEEDFKVGSIVEGEVSKVTTFGVFVKFPNGVEGLAHISELSVKEIPDVSKFLPVGTKESFRVVKSSSVDRKLGLSLKAAQSNEAYDKYKKESVESKDFSKAPFKKRNVKENFSKYEDKASMRGSLQLALEKAKANSKSEDKDDSSKE